MASDIEHTSVTFQTTKFCNKKTVLSWTIANFSLSEKIDNGEIKSKPFSNRFTKSTWLVRLYANGEGENNHGHLSASVCLQASERRRVQAKLIFSFFDIKGNSIHRSEARTFNYAEGRGYGFSKLADKDEFLRTLPDDTLKVQVEIWEAIDGDPKPICKSRRILQTLSSELFSMYQKHKFCDLIIRVGNVDLEVHRAVVAASSPVFEAMLDHGMLESTTNKIEITDFDVDVVEQVVHYIYSRECPFFGHFDIQYCLDILRAADKYALDELKAMSASHLISRLSIENIAKILFVAHMHTIENLKDECLKFICSNKMNPALFQELDCKQEELWKDVALKLMEYSGVK